MAAHGREAVLETALEMARHGWFSDTPQQSEDEQSSEGTSAPSASPATATEVPSDDDESDDLELELALPPRPHALPPDFDVDEALSLPRAQRVDMYRSALANAGVDLTESFEAATARIADDERSQLLATVGERKVAFAEYRRSLVEAEVDHARSRAAIKRSRFMADLAATSTVEAKRGGAGAAAVRRAVAAAAGGSVDEYPSSDDEIAFQLEQKEARHAGVSQNVTPSSGEEAEAYRRRLVEAPSWLGSRSRWTDVGPEVPSLLPRSARMRLFLEEVSAAATAEDAEYARILREQAKDAAHARAALRSLLAGELQPCRLPPTYAATAAALGHHPAFAAVALLTSGSHPCELYDDLVRDAPVADTEEGEVM